MPRRSVARWFALALITVGLTACSTTTPSPATGSAPVVVGGPAGPTAPPASPPAATQPPPADPWPRHVTLGNADALIYQPQIDSWTGNQLAWRVAVALRPSGTKTETFGVLWGTARTEVDRTTRSVNLEDVVITRSNFPTLPQNGAAYLPGLQSALKSALATMALDSLETSLKASQTVKPVALPVKNDPPTIIVSYGPALLVPIDGPPVIRPIPDTGFERVINTQATLVRATASGTYFLHVYDGWLSSPSMTGPWTRASAAPPSLDDVATRLAAAGTVDMLDGGPNATPRPSLAGGVPTIYVTETPTELIVFKGQPNFVPVTSTGLLWATNSAIDVLVDTSSSNYYILISGRWY